MKKKWIVLSLCVAGFTYGAEIDGKWVAKVDLPAAKQSGAESAPRQMLFDLKANGDKLEGTLSGAARRGGGIPIENGKVSGETVSFQTTVPTRNGDRKLIWQGKVSGEELKLTRTVDGRKRGREITATRQ